MTNTVSFNDLPILEGARLGTSEWLEVTQSMINQFADATGDHQWIHVDPERAKVGPFGGPIAHGYLTLALLIPMWSDLLDVTGVSTKVNYGLNKARFPAPVPVGASIRAVATLAKVEAVAGSGLQLTGDVTIEIEGSDKPACVAQPMFRFYP